MLWRIVETLLVLEVITVMLLCLPFSLWRRMVIRTLPAFHAPNMKKVILATQFLLAVLFLDALNGVYRPSRRYFPDTAGVAHQSELARKFRVERNLHISGFCLLLLFLIDRLITFIVDLEESRTKLEEKTEQVQLLSDQLEQRASATARERAHHMQDQHPSGSGVRQRNVTATE